MPPSYRYKVADPRLGVFFGQTPTQPERARRDALEDLERGRFTVGADPDAPPAPSPPETLEHAKTEGLLSMLMLDHNTIQREGDSHESPTEMARTELLRALESLSMTATGALRATIARPDLVAIAAKDAVRATSSAFDAYTRSRGPLAKTIAGEMMRAASNATRLAVSLQALPGTTPAPGAPGAPPPAPAPGAAPDVDQVDELEQASRPRPRRGGLAFVGLIGASMLGVALAKGRRR